MCNRLPYELLEIENSTMIISTFIAVCCSSQLNLLLWRIVDSLLISSRQYVLRISAHCLTFVLDCPLDYILQSRYLMNVWWKFIAFLWFIANGPRTNLCFLVCFRGKHRGDHVCRTRTNAHTLCTSMYMRMPQKGHKTCAFKSSSILITMHIVCCMLQLYRFL